MESCKEFEGRDVESAIQNACEALNVSRKEIRYDVLSRGSTGVFGFVGVKKARIRVVLPVKTVAAQEYSRAITESEIPATPSPEMKTGAKSIVDEAFQDLEPMPEQETTPVSDELVTLAESALKRMVDFIVDDAVIEKKKDKGLILFNIKCENSGVLIGKHGQTLEAIQYLMDKIVNKKSETRIRVQLDVEGYVQNRMSTLTKLAQRMAEKAKKTGKPATINQMNAYDRRIVHLALKDDGEVKTQSMGDGYYRKLIIFPRRGGRRRPKQIS